MDIHKRMVADATARAQDIQIVFIGDSITAQWTGASIADLWKRFADHGAINLAISGDGTEHVLWRIQHGVLDPLHPKMVFLLIGTNDCGTDPQSIAYGVWTDVVEIRKRLPDARILVEGIFPRNDPKSANRATVVAANKLLAKLDDGKMVKFFDFGDRFLQPDGTFLKGQFPGGVHPDSHAAMTIWADAIQPIAEQWLTLPPVASVPPPPCPIQPPPPSLKPVTPVTRNDWMMWHDRYATEAAKGNIDLLFVGDSLLNEWPEPLFNQEYKSLHAVRFPLGQDRTENLLWQFTHGELDGIQPKLLVLQLEETLMDNTPVENVSAGMDAVIKVIREKLPATKILLLASFPMGEKPTDTRRPKVAAYNALLAKKADDKTIFYLDIGSAFLDPQGNLTKNISYDQVRLTARAYPIWANAQRVEIQKLMGISPTPHP
jgi:lysophospholipase L1-like esterase